MKLSNSYVELLGSDIVFLMSIDWNGSLFNFSTMPIEIETDGGEIISYQGAINDPEFRLQSSILGFSVESNSIPMEVYFDNINVSQQIFQGNILDESEVEISYILIRNFEPVSVFEQRIVMMVGKIKESIFGHIDQPVGYVAFSIENEIDDQIIQIIKPEQKISHETFSDPHDETATGKPYPFIIGSPGNSIPYLTSSGAIINKSIYCTPAYLSNQASSSGGIFVLLIAGHHVEASTVEIIDFTNRNARLSINNTNDLLGNPIAEVIVQTYLENNESTSENAGNPEYWVKWIGGGGFSNPFASGVLEYAGDILLYLLMLTRAKIDFAAFDAIRGYLNSYKFAGYINTDITVQEFIQTNMLPFLPVEIVNGPKGLRPIIPMIFRNNPSSIFDFVVNQNCRLTSALSPSVQNNDIVNEITIKYGYSGFFNKYLGYYTVKDSHYTTISKNRYGVRKKEIELEFVQDFATVQKIGNTILRQKSLGYYILEIQADFEYGYINLGDVVTLTSNIHGFQKIKCQIIAKEYQDKQWNYTLMVEDNPITNNRSVL